MLGSAGRRKMTTSALRITRAAGRPSQEESRHTVTKKSVRQRLRKRKPNNQKICSSNSLSASLWQKGSLRLVLRLGSRDAVDDKAHATLGDDVRSPVAALDSHHGTGA